MTNKKHKLTPICALHYIKLVYRSALFLLVGIIYIVGRVRNSWEFHQDNGMFLWLIGLVWLIYTAEMASRFFPSKLESMGCGKQFRRNFIATEESTPRLQSWKQTFAVAAAWIALNAIIGALFYTDIIDEGILVLISLAYGVCDMICILFFCPFQTWFMKNRCCNVCRIYNWDFAMMFTPLIFMRSVYTWSLVIMSLILLVRWELTLRLHPERFSECTNASLSCKNCKEKLCHHKKQLRGFWEKNKSKFKFKFK